MPRVFFSLLVILTLALWRLSPVVAEEWSNAIQDSYNVPGTSLTAELNKWTKAFSLRVKTEGILYPEACRRRDCWVPEPPLIRFDVTNDGYVKHVQIIKSSGDPLIDKAVVDGIEKLQPFLPIPDGGHFLRVEIKAMPNRHQ